MGLLHTPLGGSGPWACCTLLLGGQARGPAARSSWFMLDPPSLVRHRNPRIYPRWFQSWRLIGSAVGSGPGSVFPGFVPWAPLGLPRLIFPHWVRFPGPLDPPSLVQAPASIGRGFLACWVCPPGSSHWISLVQALVQALALPLVGAVSLRRLRPLVAEVSLRRLRPLVGEVSLRRLRPLVGEVSLRRLRPLMGEVSLRRRSCGRRRWGRVTQLRLPGKHAARRSMRRRLRFRPPPRLIRGPLSVLTSNGSKCTQGIRQ